MKIAPIPVNEAERLAALRRYGILDTPAEDEFDDFTFLAAQICGTPIALVSLVDAERQWFKSRVGLDAAETPRDISFCGHAIHGRELFEVPDTVDDERFRDNPLVTGAPSIRFYAGTPLTTPGGFNIGTLCVIDRVPRRLTPEQRDSMTRLSRQAVARMEMRLANLRLAQQTAFQSAILANAASAIIATTSEGIITHFNPEAERMLGYTAAEMIGLQTPGVFHDPVEVVARAAELSCKLGREIAPGFAVFVAEASEGRSETQEWTYIRKDGSQFPVLLSVSALYGATGNLDGFLGIARDITQQKATVEALRQERQCLELALSSANLAMWDAQATSGRVFLDERWAAMIGEERKPTVTTVDELLQRVPDEYRPLLLSTVTDAMNGRIAKYEVEHPILTRAGTLWILSHGQVTEWDSQGRALRIIGVNADITKRKELDRKLHDSEAFLRDLFDNSGDLMQSVGIDGSLLFVNRAWRETLGYTESEVESLNIFRVIAPDCHEHCRAIFQRLMDGEQAPMMELVLLSKGGRRIEVEGNVTVRFESGRPLSTRGILRDVTARNENERQRRAGVEQAMAFQRTLLALRDHERDDLSKFYRLATSGIARALNVERASIWLLSPPRLLRAPQSSARTCFATARLVTNADCG